MDIGSLLEVEVKEGQLTATLGTDNSDTKDGIKTLKPSQLVTSDELLYSRRMFGNDIAQVRFRRIHCTACDVHIGSAPSEAPNMQEHPVLKTLLCAACRDFYGDGNFDQGDDATDMFCRWCANGGNLYCCSYCSNTFCDKCIKRNFDPDIRDKIEADEKWKCFVCDPLNLYTLRAICRALLHHVKTLSRILMADRTMSAKEIEVKMDLDDSKCCIGRRSRRRRRESSSEEDSSQRTRSPSQRRSRPKNNHWTNSKRRKSSSQNEKQNLTILNGTSRFIPIAPHYVLQEMIPSTTKYRNEDEDIPPPFLHCEQTMIEGENETVTPQGLILKSQSKIPDSILYNSAISLNPLPPQNIVRGTMTRGGKTMIPIRPLHKVDSIPPRKVPQIIRRLPNYSVRPNAPMVTIPSLVRPRTTSVMTSATTQINPTPVQRSNYLRCKSNLTAEPNIIDLESETDELIVMESTPITNEARLDGQCETEVVSTQLEDLTPSVSTALRRKLFEETVDNPIIAIDNIIGKLRERLKNELDCVTEVPDSNSVHNARVKIKIINRKIDEIVNELAAFNNSMIRQYQPWKKSKITSEIEGKKISKPIVLKQSERSSKYISLNMECVRDSESDLDDDDNDNNPNDDNDDHDTEYLLNFSNRLVKFDEKDMINQGTLARVETEDKATQAYDTVTIDYDKTIGYSLLMRADYDFKRKKEVFKPVVIHDKFFGKYEEQFISYLQYFEDSRSILGEGDNNEKTTLDDMTFTEVIDADIAAQKKSESFVEVCNDAENDKCEEESTISCVNKDNNEKIDTQSHELITSPKKFNENDTHHDDDIKMTSSQEAKHQETVIAVRALIDKESNDNIIDKWKSTEDDDEL